MAGITADLMRHYRRQYFISVDAFERAEDVFADVTAQYREREGLSWLADIKAGSDQLRMQAQGDASYYRDRALMYAAGVQMLFVPMLGLLQRLPRPLAADLDDGELRDAHAPVATPSAGFAINRQDRRRWPDA